MKGSVTIRFVALNTSSYSTLFANSTTEFPSGRRNIINTVYRLEEHCKLEIWKIKKTRQIVVSGMYAGGYEVITLPRNELLCQLLGGHR